jgi:hypothetical protein
MPIGSVVLGSILAALFVVSGGCKSEVSANASSAVTPEASSPAQTVTASTPQPKFDESAFRLESSAPNSVKVGESFPVRLVLSAKAPFHVNAEYPHRFKVASVLGGKADSEVVTRDPAKVSPSTLELMVPVTASGAGKGEIVGELSFSLCTEDKCLMEKRKLKAEFVAN